MLTDYLNLNFEIFPNGCVFSNSILRKYFFRKIKERLSDIDLTSVGPSISCSQVKGSVKTIADGSIRVIYIEKNIRLATDDNHQGEKFDVGYYVDVFVLKLDSID